MAWQLRPRSQVPNVGGLACHHIPIAIESSRALLAKGTPTEQEVCFHLHQVTIIGNVSGDATCSRIVGQVVTLEA